MVVYTYDKNFDRAQIVECWLRKHLVPISSCYDDFVNIDSKDLWNKQKF